MRFDRIVRLLVPALIAMSDWLAVSARTWTSHSEVVSSYSCALTRSSLTGVRLWSLLACCHSHVWRFRAV
jgi:hypothetical protein